MSRDHAAACAGTGRHWAEGVARRYLEARGYRTVLQNYATRGGEIDLIMRHGELLVFVEVRQRRSDRYGSPAESLRPRKLERLRRTALRYLVERHGRDDLPLRFDLLAVHGDRSNYRIEHLQAIC